MVGDFGAKTGFATDQAGCVGQREFVAVVVLCVAEAGDEVADVTRILEKK